MSCKKKTSALALMEAASFCAGVWHKRYSGEQDKWFWWKLSFLLLKN